MRIFQHFPRSTKSAPFFAPLPSQFYQILPNVEEVRRILETLHFPKRRNYDEVSILQNFEFEAVLKNADIVNLGKCF